MKSSEKSFFRKAGVRIFIPAIVILFVSTSLLYSSYKRSAEKNDVILEMALQFIERAHVSPARINDQFSEKVFDAYLKKIDPMKWFLTTEDLRQMEVYRRQIDDHIRNKTHRLYDLTVQFMEKRIPEVQGYYREILSVPFDFTVDETWEIDHEKRDWAANSAALKENWRKQLKLQTLYRMMDALRAQEKESDASKIKTIETIESEARERVLKTFNDVFMNNLDQQNPNQIFSNYVNAILSVFDPHTTYSTPKDKGDFDYRISGQFEGIGAVLSPSDGYARVTELMPGSPSWLQGELKVNDLITKVKQEHETEPVDIFGMSLDEAVMLIRGKKGSKVTLSVRRVDGNLHEITITRDVVINEETYAKSAILNDPATNAKVGYIDLPSFYVDFRRTATGRASSKDIAQEIEKLKNEDVQGIILDLRSNGGGSLDEAVTMGGLFIPLGPIVQVKYASGSPQILSDIDPSVQYDGPLVILVSPLSGSASEIMAAAMQDYQRAVIVGASSTFGKGTVQAVIEFDDYLPANMSVFKPTGAMALTIQKYYRVNGGSVQLKGVESDIVLPDIYSEMKIGERYEDNYLPWSTVPPAKYQIWKNPVPVAMLQQKSAERISTSEDFKLVSEQAALVKQQRDRTLLSLNLTTYQQEEEKRRAENKRFEEIRNVSTSLNISAMKADVDEIKGDTAKIARSDKWLKDLNKDIFLEEALRVIGDMKLN